MRHFSSPRVEGLEFTMYDDGSGSAEYKGKKVGSVDLQTKEIRLEGDTWTPYPYESRILEMFIEQAERYAIKNYNAEKQFAAEVAAIDDPQLTGGDKVIISLDGIREDDVFDYIERSGLLGKTGFSSITELMYNTLDYNSGLTEDDPTLDIHIVSDKNNDPKLYVCFNDGLSCPTSEVPLTDKEKAEINSFIEKELGCSANEYIYGHEINERIADEKLSKEFPEAKRHYEDMLLKAGNGGKLDRAAAAELLLTADMITIAELSPYFEEDKKAAIKLDETTAEFLINKSPELKQAFEDKGYDNWKDFFEVNHGEAFIEANDNIGITIVINDNKEYPLPLSPAEQNILKDKLDEEVRRRNKEDLEDKDGDHIPDRIDTNYSPEGFNTQTDMNYTKNAEDEYRKALVTADEYDKLQENGFKCQKAKTVHEDGRIPIRFKAAEKENFEKIVNSLGGKHGGIHI